MSWEVEDVNGKKLHVFMTPHAEHPTVSMGDTMLTFSKFSSLVTYVITNIRGKMPDEFQKILREIRHLYVLNPVAYVPDPRRE